MLNNQFVQREKGLAKILAEKKAKKIIITVSLY